LLRGGRPAWNSGSVAGERRRPAASSIGSDMAPPRVSEPDRGSSPGAARRRTVTDAYESGSLARDLVRAADQSGSAWIAVSTKTGMPRRMEVSSDGIAAALSGMQKRGGADRGLARAWCSSIPVV
jgi:hypothetical protein